MPASLEILDILEKEGVDIKSGLSLSGGIIDNYIKTLEVFYDDGLKKTNLLRDCLQKKDYKLYITFVHGIKSASLSIGDKKVSEFAKSLESAGRNGLYDFIAENNEIFLTELGKLLDIVKTVLDGRTGKEKAELDGGDLEFLKTSLSELKTALENMEAGKINNLTGELENRTFDRKTNDAVHKLSQLILISDYDEAISLINKINNIIF